MRSERDYIAFVQYALPGIRDSCANTLPTDGARRFEFTTCKFMLSVVYDKGSQTMRITTKPESLFGVKYARRKPPMKTEYKKANLSQPRILIRLLSQSWGYQWGHVTHPKNM